MKKLQANVPLTGYFTAPKSTSSKSSAPKTAAAPKGTPSKTTAAKPTRGKKRGAVSNTSNAPQAKAAAKKAAPKASTPAKAKTGKGRSSARQLEADIVTLLSTQQLSAGEISEALKRQRPTVVKALERMQARKQINRKKSGRSFRYFPLDQAAQPAAAPQSAQTAESSPADTTAPTAVDFGSAAGSSPLVNAILDRWLAAERKLWEMEQN